MSKQARIVPYVGVSLWKRFGRLARFVELRLQKSSEHKVVFYKSVLTFYRCLHFALLILFRRIAMVDCWHAGEGLIRL